MIGYLKGKVIDISAETAIISVGGVGYEVFCSGAAFSKMSQGAECEIYTYMQVSEQNGVQLFGFADRTEKNMFMRLISVSGVGCKTALGVLTSMDVNQVAVAIATGDSKALSRVKGLGKKTAERLILELKDSVSAPVSAGGVSVGAVTGVSGGNEDSVVALMSLGFTRAESETAVAKAVASGAKTVEEIIMIALKGM